MKNHPIPHVNFRQVTPILAIQDGFLITKRGDYSMLYRVDLPEVFSMTVIDYQTITSTLSAALNILPEGVALQRMDMYTPVSPSLNTEEKSYAALRDIRRMNGKRVIQSESYFIFTRLAKPNMKRSFGNTLFDCLTTGKVNGLFEEVHYSQAVVKGFEFDIEGLIKTMENALEKGKAMRFTRLHDAEIEELVFSRYFNLAFTGNANNVFVDYTDSKTAGTVGNNVINVFSMEPDGLPPSVYTSIVEGNFRKEGIAELPVSFLHDTAFNLDFPHIVNQVIYTLPQKPAFEKLNRKMNFMTGTSAGNAQNRRNAAYINQFLDEYQGKGADKLVGFHYGILLVAPLYDEPYYNDCYGQLRSLLGSTKMKFSINHYNTLRYFFSYAPGCGGEIPEADRSTCLSVHAACFGVYESNFRSATGGVLFVDRKSEWPIYIDLWYHPLITNKNALIVGPSGTGKSYTLNYFVRHYLDHGDDVVIVDLGGSYARLNALYRGINIECSSEKPLAFNPFLVVGKDQHGKYLPMSEDDSEFITLLLFTAWQSANVNSKITSEVNAVIKELLQLFYDYVNKAGIFPDFTEFYHFVREQFEENTNYKELTNTTFNKESFLLVMRFFIKGGRGFNDGQYHYLFNVKENPNIFNSQFIIFELEEIKSNKVLFPITYYILTKVVLDKLLKQNKVTGRRLYFILDEVWVLMSGEYGDVSIFIEYAYRTFRKHNGSVNIATQDIMDVFKNPVVGAAIKENCDIKILKMQNLDKLQSISDALQLSDHNRNVLYSMTDKYRDVYIQFKDKGVVYRIETDEFSLGLYTSDPDHKRWLQQDMLKTGSLSVTLENFANHFSK